MARRTPSGSRRRPSTAGGVMRGSRSSAGRRRPRPQAGFNLLLVITFVTVLNVAVAAAMPRWSQVMQRAREQELIFRGLQYAEAIRVFQARFGRYPVSLEELVEVNPRCIRRLWDDPMHPEGKWALIHAEAQTPDGDLDDDDDDDEEDESRANAPGPCSGCAAWSTTRRSSASPAVASTATGASRRI